MAYAFVCSGNAPPDGIFLGDDSFIVINIDNVMAPIRVAVLTDVVNLSSVARMVIRGNYAYVCAQGNDLFTIVNISNPLAPVVIGSVAILGAWDVALSGNYAFVTGSWNQNFHSVDISDPLNPFIADTIATTGPMDPSGVKVLGNLAYVVGDWGFEIFDIINPLALASVSWTPDSGAGELTDCSALVVEGNFAYVCADTFFTIMDVTNPAAPGISDTFQDGVDLPAGQLNGLYGIYKVGDVVYLCAGGGFYFTVLDVTNPAVIAMLGVLDITTIIPANTPRPVEVMVDSNYAYVIMGNTGNTTNHGLHILNIANPAAMTLMGSLVGGGAPNFLMNALGMGAIFNTVPTVQTLPATGVT